MPGKASRTTRPQRVTETSDYVAMIRRILIGYGQRIGDDPAALVHLREIETTLRDAVNHGIWLANQDGLGAGEKRYSMNDMSRILGVSRPAISKRARFGEAVHIAIQMAKHHGAVIRIGDIRAERAAGLAAAELTDRTGSERERLAATGTDNVRPLRRQ